MEDHAVSQSPPVLASNSQTGAELPAAFTPGPWMVPSGMNRIVSEGTWHTIAVCAPELNPNWTLLKEDVVVANVRLIAAAPDLLAALRDACERIRELSDYANRHGGMLDDEEFAPGLAAIAKATGAQTPDRSAS